MAKSTLLLAGPDVHKESIAVAHATGGCADARVFVGAVGTRQADLEKLIRRLQSQSSRAMSSSPRLSPRRPGDKVKTDRRAAAELARLLRSGDLTAVHVPTAEDEAIRDLCCSRDTARVTSKGCG